MLPFTTPPGGKPTIADPGLTPKFPETMVGPVLLTVEEPSTAKLDAVPSVIGAAQRTGANAAHRSKPTIFRNRIVPPPL
jgi:hypothetical protein